MNKYMKQFLKLILPAAWVKSLRYTIKHNHTRRYVKQILAERKSIYVDIGAGNKKGRNGWLTLDLKQNCDLYWDLNNGLPFPDETVHKVYSSHLFEHFTFREGQQLLDECLRVLVSGGIFSICVPNAKTYIVAYLNNDTLDETRYMAHKPAYNRTTKIDYINYVAYMDRYHKYMFDAENLIAILKNKGFKNVQLRDFDPDIDLEERNFNSLYAEGIK